MSEPLDPDDDPETFEDDDELEEIEIGQVAEPEILVPQDARWPWPFKGMALILLIAALGVIAQD